ncbi:hypothetical protein [uncultured Tessaracoccus sp.]|uniref:hypothetical protein n=1 Tax=uncultured Tessaracoccus sp. TaxID=905023 RepID=UPI0025EBD6E7|nr:hypothetical protein [uncultured Tessaracoccus sp.]
MPASLGDRFLGWLLAEPDHSPRQDHEPCTRIADCAPRERVEVGGTITQHGVNLDTGWFEADLTDPTGTVRMVWLGRSEISCLKEGAVVTARGRLAQCDEHLVLYNPEFSVLPDGV